MDLLQTQIGLSNRSGQMGESMKLGIYRGAKGKARVCQPTSYIHPCSRFRPVKTHGDTYVYTISI